MSERQTTVLLAIKPEWAEAILDGKKHYEYRKQAPTRTPPYRTILYSSSPTSAIVGEVATPNVLTDHVPQLISRTVDETPHTRSDLEEYFGTATDGNALRVEDSVEYHRPIPLATLRDYCISPPQNFRYLDERHSEILELVDEERTTALTSISE